jgi:glycosyltransferase involved in cell wall biosynthesis
MIAKKVCLVFTKNFPFSKMESYLQNELIFLHRNFDLVYFVPYHESKFDERENRIDHSSFQNLSHINLLQLPSYFIFDRLERVFDITRILLKEIFNSNNKYRTLGKVRQLFFRLKHYHAISKKISETLQMEKNGSAIYCYHYWNHDSVIIDMFLQKRFGVKSNNSFSRAHSIDLFHDDWPKGYVAFEKIKIDYLKNIFAISNVGLDYLRKKFPTYRKKFQLAYLGVPDRYSGSALFPSKPFIILTVSNIAEIKRLHLMVDIMKCLPSDQFQWIHIGDGVSKYADPLKKIAASGEINFKLLGHKNSDQIHQFYNENKILCCVNLSYMEGVPVSIMESLMHGVPCIATNVGGTSELIDDNLNGYLIDSNFTTSHVAQKIVELSDNPNKWPIFSQNAREKYLNKFNSNINYSDFYQKITS